MRLDISGIELSRNDVKRNLKLPTVMSDYLAEDIGIMIGDGHIGIHMRPNNKSVEYDISCFGDSVIDHDYFSHYIKNLKKRLYNLDFRYSIKGKNKREGNLKICSKALLHFYHEVIGLPLNKKGNISFPDIIWKKKEYVYACLRGLVDTDFSLCFKKGFTYPVLKLKTASPNLIRDCERAFNILGLNTPTYYNVSDFDKRFNKYYVGHYIYLNGWRNLSVYIKNVGFSNKKNKNKLYQWLKK